MQTNYKLKFAVFDSILIKKFIFSIIFKIFIKIKKSLMLFNELKDIPFS
jgi:hypothetical protein